MKKSIFPFLLLSIGFLIFNSCDTQKKAVRLRFVSPQAGAMISHGSPLLLKLEIPEYDSAIDSIVYTIDGAVVTSATNKDSILLDTDNLLPFGNKAVAAHIYQGGTSHTTHSNVLILPPSPQNFGYKVINEYPHDPEGFTQGLEYHNGVLYESTGQYDGRSSLRQVALNTGSIQKKIQLDNQYFGEGMTIVDNKIIQLTWMEKVAFVYDLHSFNKIGEFNYGRFKEGWGLCFDGTQLILSDGSNQLYFLNKDTFQEEHSIQVYNHQGAVQMLNELEYINGKVYANVYQKDIIVIIDPKTGAVEGEINLIGIYPEKNERQYDNELNGIAYDRSANRLFITGKNWSKLFEIETVAR